MSDEPDKTPDPMAEIAALRDQFTSFVESSKPKPERTDRDLLESIADGLAKLPETLTGLLKPAGEVTPPPAKDKKPKAEAPAPVVEDAPKRKRNPFTAHWG